ncbi:polysaccharide pyruvyl transferase family protein [Roseburia inulinivorans]
MKKHYDICVAGFWYGFNYGSLLNGYAEYKLLKNMGKEVLMLHKPIAPGAPIIDREITEGHNVSFVNKYYDAEDISPRYTYDELKSLNEICDCFCAGSDQIWNYELSFHENLYMPFVEDDKKLISFSTSFGHKKDKTPIECRERIKSYLERYSAISVREKFDVEILKNNYGLVGQLVFEPVFCLDKKYYEELILNSKFNEEEPYILTYILDPNEEKRNAIIYYAKQLGVKVINLLDGDAYVREKNRKILNLPNILENIEAEDFLKTFYNAKYVITDSFHGTAFSIIFNKPFLSIGNYGRGFERFIDLLSRLDLMDRLVDPRAIPHDKKYLKPIDYTDVNEIIKRESRYTIKWLKNAVDMSKCELPELKKLDRIDKCVIQTCDIELCVGCGACFSSCHKNAISMEKNEFGYYKPTIDIEKCVNCGICTKVCPVVNEVVRSNSETPECYEVVAADKEILEKSSSGGAFSLLAHEVFEKGGCVFGAAWTDDFSVEHIMIDNENDMYKLRKSKYLQSYVGDTFRKVKEKLEEEKFVLFSGCPCQAAGLKQYLGSKEYDNLLIVDLLCGNAPSPDFFKKYIQDSYGNNILKYEFRDKTYGWNPVTTKVTFKDGAILLINKAYQSDYQRVYHNHTMCPYHCENCKYQNVPKIGDITIGDFWWINSNDKEVDSRQGISALLVNNEKAKDFFDNINESNFKVKKQVPFEWLKGNGFTVKGTHNFVSPKRSLFYDAIRTMPFSKAVNYALKPKYGTYRQNESVLCYNPKKTIFSFDENIWEEHMINGVIYLFTKSENSPCQKYARMFFNKLLVKGQKYELHIKFKINTEENCYNLHIKDSGSNYYQIIWSERVDSQNRGKWVDRTIIFVPDANIFDEFMVGAAQLVGEGSYIAFSLIDIREVY